MQKNYWTKEKENFLIQNRKLYTVKELTKLLGFKSSTSISSKIKELKLDPKLRKGDLNPLLNDTPLSYYWLGFIAADGYISKTGHFQISTSKNINHLTQLANFLSAKITTNKFSKSSYKTNSLFYYRIAIKDKIIGVQIRNLLGIIDKKTYNPISLNFFDNDIKFYSFLIGFIDGDGYIYKGNKSWNIKIEIHQSWYNILKEIQQKVLHDFNYNIPLYITKKGYAQIQIQNLIFKEFLLKLIKDYNLTTLKF